MFLFFDFFSDEKKYSACKNPGHFTAKILFMLIDSHCHIYLEDFKDDFETVMQRAFQADLKNSTCPAIDSTTNRAHVWAGRKIPGTCIAMMGLHPCSVKENFNEELEEVEQYLKQRRFAAVGEIGLGFTGRWNLSINNTRHFTGR